MDELEEIRQRRLAEMQQRQQEQILNQAKEEQRFLEQITALENMVKPRLDRQALERYGNLKSAHTQKAIQSLVVVAQLIQGGHQQISDEEYKQILTRLEPPRRETRITRK